MMNARCKLLLILLSGDAELFGDQLVLHMRGSSSDIYQLLSLTVTAKNSLEKLNGWLSHWQDFRS